jgi:hypothetical protein
MHSADFHADLAGRAPVTTMRAVASALPDVPPNSTVEDRLKYAIQNIPWLVEGSLQDALW